MHPFSIDTQERKNIIVTIALLCIPLSWLLNYLVKLSGITDITGIWWISAPSILGMAGILYKIFDEWLWRFDVLRKLRIIKTPDLSGVWNGTIATSFDDCADRHATNVKIQQTWTRISIFLAGSQSESHSLTASILTRQPGGISINYEYKNEPKPFAKSTMHAHRGTAILKLRNNIELEGEYYTGRDRNNFGSIKLKKIFGNHQR